VGQQAKLKRQRREARQARMAELRQQDEAHQRDPVFIAERDKILDPQVLEMATRDRIGQALRLTHAGWRCRTPGNEDGAGMWDHSRRRLRIIHSIAREPDGQVWAHMSISHESDALPGWYEVRDAHRLLYPNNTGHVLIVPEAEHVNEANVMHVWTCLTKTVLPDFRKMGSI
jgi:hypothetical protein